MNEEYKPQKLIMIRGWSGSGKSTKAAEIIKENPDYLHYEADMWFYDNDGNYNFDHTKLKDAHGWCQASVKQALQEGKTVICSNTFVKYREAAFYFNVAKKLGIEVEVIVMSGNFKNVHGCPEHVIENMKKNFETF